MNRHAWHLCRLNCSLFSTARLSWTLWQQRQELAGSDTDRLRARLAIETHLERIDQHRPLVKIQDESARIQADHVRRWFREVFLDVIELD